MPRVGDPQEREQIMESIFTKFYSDPANVGQDLSVAKANAEFTKKTGAMLRNKKAYQIRKAVKARVLKGVNGSSPVKAATVAAREPKPLTVAPGAKGAAALIEGTPEQLTFLQQALKQLAEHGLTDAKIDHSTGSYAVVTR
jgi:hypothetical protein